MLPSSQRDNLFQIKPRLPVGVFSCQKQRASNSPRPRGSVFFPSPCAPELEGAPHGGVCFTFPPHAPAFARCGFFPSSPPPAGATHHPRASPHGTRHAAFIILLPPEAKPAPANRPVRVFYPRRRRPQSLGISAPRAAWQG